MAKDDSTDELIAAALYLLAIVAPFVPPAVFVAKFDDLNLILAACLSIFRSTADEAPALRSLLLVASAFYTSLPRQLLFNTETSQLFNSLVELLSDSRPKLRRKAQDVIQAVAFSTQLSSATEEEHPYAKRTAQRIIEVLQTALQQSRHSKEKVPDNVSHLIGLCAFIEKVAKHWPSQVSAI